MNEIVGRYETDHSVATSQTLENLIWSTRLAYVNAELAPDYWGFVLQFLQSVLIWPDLLVALSGPLAMPM